jgi:transposase, IS5 family
MREKRNLQRSIFERLGKHPIGDELEQMSQILDANSQVLDLAYDDLVRGYRCDTGRHGMTAEQVVRSTILKQFRELSYEELAFHLTDSHSFRSFARLRMGQYPSKSVLQENMKALSEKAWIAIHHIILAYAKSKKIENGRKIRIDSTAIETDIHYPTDSSLLWDGVRVITRWLFEGTRLSPRPAYRFSDHRRVVKKRMVKIQNSKKPKERLGAYKDMLHYAERLCSYAEGAIPVLDSFVGRDSPDTFRARALAKKLAQAINLLKRVMDQTQRRVLRGEKIPAREKIVSFFETHTDIIVKSNRDTQYGHKVFLTGGRSNLILDCLIERGNPSDADRFGHILIRHKDQYGQMPRQTAADGGFASKDNLAFAKSNRVKDVVFSKKRGLSVIDMAKSNWVYRKLKNFRAGIEASISTLKRAFGLTRCTWSGWKGFKQYVWSCIVAYNLQVLARIKLAQA